MCLRLGGGWHQHVRPVVCTRGAGGRNVQPHHHRSDALHTDTHIAAMEGSAAVAAGWLHGPQVCGRGWGWLYNPPPPPMVLPSHQTDLRITSLGSAECTHPRTLSFSCNAERGMPPSTNLHSPERVDDAGRHNTDLTPLWPRDAQNRPPMSARSNPRKKSGLLHVYTRGSQHKAQKHLARQWSTRRCVPFCHKSKTPRCQRTVH